MKITLLLVLITITIFSCNQTSSKTTESNVKPPIDSLISNWEISWNKHDSAGVRNMFLADAVLIDDNLVAANAAEISEKWIHPNINVVSNLTSTKLQEWSSSDRAGYTGRYEFTAIVNDSIVAKPTGFYTVNWMKTLQGDWKITTSVIHAIKKDN